MPVPTSEERPLRAALGMLTLGVQTRGVCALPLRLPPEAPSVQVALAKSLPNWLI